MEAVSERPAALRESLCSAGPRNPSSARITTACIVAATMVSSLASAAFTDRPAPTAQLTTTVALGILIVGLAKLPIFMAAPLCLLTPAAAVVAIVTLTMATGDSGRAGQVLFCLPVLFAAAELNLGGAVLITASAIVGEVAVAVIVLPHRQAVLDLVQVEVTLILVAVVVATAGMNHYLLIARMRLQFAVDPTTRLATRRVLDDATKSALSGADPRIGTALVIIDVDKFKSINDTHGHIVGDAALRRIASVLLQASRAQDVVARMGGDEFAVLMPGCGYNVAHARAQKFVELVRDNPLHLRDDSIVPLSISAGAGHFPGRHRGDPEVLYKIADNALYAAKNAGRGRVGTAHSGSSNASRTAQPAPEPASPG